MSHKSIVFPICLIFLFSFPVRADFDEPAEKQAAYQYLNQLRENAGMVLFKKNPLLEKSAGHHARYLSINAVIGHFEEPDRPEFSGVKPSDRALFAGYNSKNVTENFSSGQKNSFESIEGLMSAIYHRFGFLAFSKNEVGISFASAGKDINFVYNMGNSQQNELCQNSKYNGSDSYYQSVCKNDEKVSVKQFDTLEQNAMKENPSIIVWPPNGAKQVLNVFYEEIP
ncbi:CAP domain-containing protein, partial [bacterium]|nr:CAP domain-containing protein [bacterium]